MFGRYSLDEPGLILADQGATLQDYLAKVPSPTFTPDADNVIPIVDGDWFEDDVVGGSASSCGLRSASSTSRRTCSFVTESLGVKNLRDYFITRLVSRSSTTTTSSGTRSGRSTGCSPAPRGRSTRSIYMHRYTPSTVSTVLTVPARVRDQAGVEPPAGRAGWEREGSGPAAQDSRRAERVRARHALPEGIRERRHRPRRRREGELPEVRRRPEEDHRLWRCSD